MGIRADIPNWPRRMKAPLAAAYLGVSPSKFDDGVKRKFYPAGKKDGRNVLWDRAELDRWVDQWATSPLSGGLKSW